VLAQHGQVQTLRRHALSRRLERHDGHAKRVTEQRGNGAAERVTGDL
jgi:hypothetical protein